MSHHKECKPVHASLTVCAIGNKRLQDLLNVLVSHSNNNNSIQYQKHTINQSSHSKTI